MKNKELYVGFPLLNAFAQRELPKAVAVKIGTRVADVRALFNVLEERRVIEVQKYETDDAGKIKKEADQTKFQQDWQVMLNAEVESFPTWKTTLGLDDLPDDLTGLEAEVLIKFGIIDKPE